MEEAEGQALTGEDLAIEADVVGYQGEGADAAGSKDWLSDVAADSEADTGYRPDTARRQGGWQSGQSYVLANGYQLAIKCRTSRGEDKALAAHTQTPMYTAQPDCLNTQQGSTGPRRIR